MKLGLLNFSGNWNCSYKPTRELLVGTMTVLFAWILLGKANAQRCKGTGCKGYLPPLRVLMGSVATLFLWVLMAGVLANAQSTGREPYPRANRYQTRSARWRQKHS